MRSASLGALLLSLALVFAKPAPAQETYSNQTLGFAVTKPADWHYVTAEQARENLKRTEFATPEFKELVAKYSRTPFFAISKYKEPYDDLNPSFKVNVTSLGALKDESPEKLAELVTANFPRMFKDYAVDEGPVATEVAGHPAGYMRIHYTLEISGRDWPVSSELWVVPRGELMFLIGVGLRQDEKTGSREEIRGIVETIRID